MLKKTVALGSLLTLMATSATLAHGHFRSGFLAGAHVGISNGSGSFSSNFDTNQVREGAASGKTRKTSVLFGILGGYRHIFHDGITHDGITVGFDVSGNVFTNNELNKKLDNVINGIAFPFKNKLTRRYSVIPSVNIGKIFCARWHVALGLGFAISGFKHQINAPFPTSTNPLNSQTSTTTRAGFVPSLRVEYAATQNVSVIGNVSYEIYKKISKKFGDKLTTPFLLGSSYTSSISPRYLTLNVGAVYRF